MARSIAGLFEDRVSAEKAIDNLKNAGFDPAHIGVVMQDKKEAEEVAEEHGTQSTEGAVGGGIVGGTAGALLAATGALVIPGIGPFVSAGILATALVGGAAGWLVGGLIGLGIPKEEAEYYEDRVQSGSTLVTVEPDGRDAEARQILLDAGAEDLQNRGFGGATQQPQPPVVQEAQPYAGTTTSQSVRAQTATDGDIRVPVMEEELVVGKRQEEVGRVHLHKDVVEEQRTVEVPLRREEVTVERVPVTGQANADTTDAFTNRDIDVPVMGEEAVVDKRVREAEEVRLHKDSVSQEQQVSDTVRKERVTIEGADETSTIARDQTGGRSIN